MKEDLRRLASSTGVGTATIVTPLRFTPTALHQRATDACRRPTPDQKRPLTLPLRI
ncbi:MAG TPA: hypothetical protein VMW48_12305 [Vicinamibacterales bacterium]|nr:hypothetical protein [Vicinamibacterales bacterium]